MLQSLRGPAQECLINIHSKQADGLEGKLASTLSLNLVTDSNCSVTAGREILGLGVWLCFICCPLQGGSNLQPTHEPVNLKPVLLNLNPKKLFCLDLRLGRPLALSVGQLQDEVTGSSTMDPICV